MLSKGVVRGSMVALRLPPGGEDELTRMYTTAARHSFQYQTHVVGDAAFEIAVRVLRRTNDQVRLAPNRFTVMHVFLPDQVGLTAMRRMESSPPCRTTPCCSATT